MNGAAVCPEALKTKRLVIQRHRAKLLRALGCERGEA